MRTPLSTSVTASISPNQEFFSFCIVQQVFCTQLTEGETCEGSF